MPIHLGLGYSPIGRTHKRGQVHCKLSLFTAHQSLSEIFPHHLQQQLPLSLHGRQYIITSMSTPAGHQALAESSPTCMKYEKRSPEIENGSPVLKKARITHRKASAPKTHSTNLIFRKFVNNALNEKAAVGVLCILSYMRNVSLTMDYRGTQRISKSSEESSRQTHLRNQHPLLTNYR